jgi:hypothetical protein
MHNFRLMRATSSYLCERSHFDHADPASRLGLRIEFDDKSSGSSEFVVGGWCIGSVIDTAASRAAYPGVASTRAAPSSMAMNVNVNVEWWDSDRLYSAFDDPDRGVTGSGADPTKEVARAYGVPNAGATEERVERFFPESTLKSRVDKAVKTVADYSSDMDASKRGAFSEKEKDARSTAKDQAGGNVAEGDLDRFRQRLRDGGQIGGEAVEKQLTARDLEREGRVFCADPWGPDADPVGLKYSTAGGTKLRESDGRAWFGMPRNVDENPDDLSIPT